MIIDHQNYVLQCLRSLFKVMYRHYRILQKVADNLMSMIAEAGGEKSDFFADLFDNFPLHTLRFVSFDVESKR